jgi:UDP-N-acetylglucosamine 4-epimerase
MMYLHPFHQTDLSSSSFLVTGGAGFIGSHIVEYLLKYRAGKVRVLDNFSTGSWDNISAFSNDPRFELMEGDIRNYHTCRQAMEGIDYVSHQAALGSVPRSVQDPITTNEVNISGFLNILTAAKERGVRRMVYAASSSAYGDHIQLPKVEEITGRLLSPYAVTKYVNELYANVFSGIYNFHTIGLRYFNVFGPRQNVKGPYAAVIPLFIEAALKNQSPVIYGDGETSRDFTFVENAVQANIKALMVDDLKQHEVLNVASGQRTTLNSLWEKISSMAGVHIKPIYSEERKGDVKHSLAEVSKAEKLLNYMPVVLVAEGLRISLEWYRHATHATVNS